MPRDARFVQAGNHGEWGPDTYAERYEYGMDGPNETRWGHGLGLPRREDLESNANPQMGGGAEEVLTSGSMSQGVGKKEV
jgi:hypothetical protein